MEQKKLSAAKSSLPDFRSGKSVLERMQCILNNPENLPTDVILRFGHEHHAAKEIAAHRHVLALGCQYFATMFDDTSNFVERTQEIITLNEVEPEAFMFMIRKFYGDDSEDFAVENVMGIMIVCREFLAAEIEKSAKIFVQRSVNPGNVVQYYSDAVAAGFDDLLEFLLGYMCMHCEIVFLSEDFLSSDRNIMMAILDHNGLHCDEKQVWNALIDWTKHNVEPEVLKDGARLRAFLGPALHKVRYAWMSPGDLMTGPAKLGVLLPQEVFDILSYIHNRTTLAEEYNVYKRFAAPVTLERSLQLQVIDKKGNVVMHRPTSFEIRADLAPTHCEAWHSFFNLDTLKEPLKLVVGKHKISATIGIIREGQIDHEWRSFHASGMPIDEPSKMTYGSGTLALYVKQEVNPETSVKARYILDIALEDKDPIQPDAVPIGRVLANFECFRQFAQVVEHSTNRRGMNDLTMRLVMN